MAVTNGDFELGSSIIGVPLDWVVTSATSSSLALFGDYEVAYEDFSWGEVVESTTTWLVLPFKGDTPGYESFSWGGIPIEEWDSGWVVSTLIEDFLWSTYDEVFTAGSSTPVEDFLWSTYDGVFTAGSNTPVESFETGW